MKRNPLGVPFV